MNKGYLAVIFFCTVLFGTTCYSQDTYTNYCPDTGYDIKLNLTIEFFDSKKNIVIEKQFKNVPELLENRELQNYKWAVCFETVKARKDCFRISFTKDFENLLFDRKVQFIRLKYYSGKNMLDEVTINYDVKRKQSYSHIKNGSQKF